MTRFILHRALSLATSLVVASMVVFAVIEVIPGDPAAYMLGLNASPDTVAALRETLGLNQSLAMRYLSWVAGMLTGDFGTSYTYRVPVADLVMDRLAVSLPLAVGALVLSTALALPAGLIAAARRGRATDAAVIGATQLGIAVPNFWFAMLLVLLLAVRWRIFPAGGFALPQAAILARVLRSALIETMGQDYIRTARAKGLSRARALLRHALRNAMIPVLTILGMQFSFLLAGAIIIENVFYIPGLGRLIFQAITQRDLIVVESVVMMLVFAVIMVTFLTDLAYASVDPRLRRRA